MGHYQHQCGSSNNDDTTDPSTDEAKEKGCHCQCVVWFRGTTLATHDSLWCNESEGLQYKPLYRQNGNGNIL